MTKQNSIELQYVVFSEHSNRAVHISKTRQPAREYAKAAGGKSAGYRIEQQFIVRREVR